MKVVFMIWPQQRRDSTTFPAVQQPAESLQKKMF